MDSLMSNINLILYISIWIITIIAYQKKKQYFDAGSLILFSYLFYSIVSLILFNSPLYTFNGITLFPFIYLYLMLRLAFMPILKYDSNKIDKIQNPNILLFNTLSIFIILVSLIQLPKVYSSFSTNIYRLILDSSGGIDMYNESLSRNLSTGDGNITNLPYIFSSAFRNIGILLFFYYLTIEKRSKLILAGLATSILINLLSSVAIAQRGAIFEVLLSLILSYFVLRKFIHSRINRIIKVVGIFVIIASTIPVIYMTISRFGDNEGGELSSLYFYVGQENLYFNNYGLDNGGIRYGDRTFPLFKRILGFDNVPINFWERRIKYPDLKINDEVFIGFVGDFTLDFGPYIAPLIFIIFSLFALKKTRVRKRRLLFHQLILIHFVMYLCMLGGMKLYPFSDVGGNLQLIVYIFLYIVFRLDYESLKSKNRIT